MNINDFHKYGHHFCNLDEEQLTSKFNFDEVAELENNKTNQRALLLLSQYLVGNVSGTFDEIKKARIQTRKDIFEVWFNILQDPDEMRGIAKYIVNDFI